MESEGIPGDHNLQEVPQHVLEFVGFGGRRLCGDDSLEHHLDGCSLWHGGVEGFYIQ